MKKPELISDGQIANANLIETCDPKTMRGHQLWGQASVPRIRAPGAPPYENKIVIVEIAESDNRALLDFIARVRQLRGSLLQEVQRLRTNVKAEPKPAD